MRNLIAAALLFLPAGGIAAADISVMGLTAGRAVVSIDHGKPRSMSAGQVTAEGVKLISATTESATFEVAGKRQTLSMGQSISVAEPNVAAQRATLLSDSGGHFLATAEVNGISIRFLVDTGATLVTLGSEDAKRAGINYLRGQPATLQTANGSTTAYRVKLDSVRVGEIVLTNVDGAVVEGKKVMGELSLLGMSFLNRVDMRREGTTMILTKRF